jgi:hypothetical protein
LRKNISTIISVKNPAVFVAFFIKLFFIQSCLVEFDLEENCNPRGVWQLRSITSSGEQHTLPFIFSDTTGIEREIVCYLKITDATIYYIFTAPGLTEEEIDSLNEAQAHDFNSEGVAAYPYEITKIDETAGKLYIKADKSCLLYTVKDSELIIGEGSYQEYYTRSDRVFSEINGTINRDVAL